MMRLLLVALGLALVALLCTVFNRWLSRRRERGLMRAPRPYLDATARDWGVAPRLWESESALRARVQNVMARPHRRLSTSNFEHGMSVDMGGETCHVHAPRWWNVVARVRWLLLARRRRRQLTLTDGETVRLISHD